jgi:predicted Zn-dependent peptidase
MRPALWSLLLAPLALAQVTLPAYSRDVLPNGVVLLLSPNPAEPLVHFRVVVKGGTEAEPAQLAGIANLTAALLRKGSSKRTSVQFSNDLDFLGGTYGAVGSTSSTSISAEFLSKDFDQGLDLLTDALLHPAFPEQETAKELARQTGVEKALKDNAQASIARYLRSAFFGKDHPYGKLASDATVARIQRKDVLEFYRRMYVGGNLIVAVTGGFDAAAKAKLMGAFRQAPEGAAYRWSSAPSLTRKGRVLLVDKPDATQTYFQIAQPGVDRKNPDAAALDIVNTLFGGRFTSMLNDELRVNSGLTYGASSNVERSRLPGTISISTYTETSTTVQAVDLALDILKRLGEQGITQDQLTSAKAYIKGSFPTTRLETIDQVAAAITDLELFGLGREDIDGYFARLDAVTLAAANAAARKYYQSDDLTLVLLGAADKIRESVRKYGTLAELPIALPGYGNE